MALTDALNRKYGPFCDGVQRIMDGSWKGMLRSAIRSTGYVDHTLEAALWCVSERTNFRDAVLLAVNFGDDADRVGAVTGQIAGSICGFSGIPHAWVERLAWSAKVDDIGKKISAPNLVI